MHITVRGWARDLGETTVMSGALRDAVVPESSLKRDQLYKKIQNPDDRRRTSVRISSSTEVRLGGTYLMHVELSRKEIAQLFFETHNGSMVRMIKAFIDEEDVEDRAQKLKHLATIEEMRRERKISEDADIPS